MKVFSVEIKFFKKNIFSNLHIEFSRRFFTKVLHFHIILSHSNISSPSRVNLRDTHILLFDVRNSNCRGVRLIRKDISTHNAATFLVLSHLKQVLSKSPSQNIVLKKNFDSKDHPFPSSETQKGD